MTAPAVNGTRYPQPVDALLPAARALDLPEGQTIPSRNRLMREFRIGAPKAEEIRTRLTQEREQRLRGELSDRFGYVPPDARGPAPDPWLYAEPIGPNPEPTGSGPGAESTPDLDATSAPPDAVVAHPEPAPARLATVRTPAPNPDPPPAPTAVADERPAEVSGIGHPDTEPAAKPVRPVPAWPVVLLALPAFVAVWSGWVGLGGLTGFGVVHPLPGIADGFSINSAITLPIGMEAYAAYALYVWLSGRVPAKVRRFAAWSAIGSLVVGAAGQVAYHLLVAAGITAAPWWITAAVACLPVVTLGLGATLAHLVRAERETTR